MASVAAETSGPAFDDVGAGETASTPLDAQLLDQFLGPDESAAEAAFQTLVRRHGPMVMGVCRHILGQIQDAEDAFQAVFLVLARKAGSIHDRRALGRWLYEVTYRIAIRSRVQAVRRRTHEREGAEMAAEGAGLDQDHGLCELRPVLHEEVNRLPEKYRTAVVLCYLEGRTNEEAAEILRWPVGTVKGRLSRAREMLRSRLTRRGLGLSAMFLVSSLSRNETFAEMVPPRLVESTASTAMRARNGGRDGPGEVPARVAELAQNTVPPPWTIVGFRFRTIVLGVLVAIALLLGLTAGLTFGGAMTRNLFSGTYWANGWNGVTPRPCH